MKKEETQKGKYKKIILAPFQILKVEKLYYFWFLSFILSFSGIIIDTFNGNLCNSFLQGAFYSTGIAIIIPTCFEFLVEYQAVYRETKKEEYSTYKACAIYLNIFALVLLFLFYMTDLKSSFIIQIITFFIIGGLSFYTYLVTKMSRHNILLKDYKTRPYIETEQEEVGKITKDAQSLKAITTEKGGSIKL